MIIKLLVVDKVSLEFSNSEPEVLKIMVSGITRCSSCKMPRLEQKSNSNGTYEFYFVADCDQITDDEHVPTGDVLYYLKPIPSDLKRIIVTAETNSKEVLYERKD